MNNFEENLNIKLKTIGFTGHNLVIDAACGSGDWSKVLSSSNSKVIGYDFSKELIFEAQSKISNILNLSFVAASLISSPIKINTADAILCADSLVFVNPIAALNAFYYQLKYGGLVYISVNSFGWILNCIFFRGIKGKDISKIKMGIRIIYETFMRRIFYPNFAVTNNVYTIRELKKLAKKAGFEIIYTGYEGTYLNQEYKNYQPQFKKTYWGIPMSLEIILKKSK
jgi:ubiquinone/menaquinone biosynthesis C-methylase UbiE